MIIEKLMVEDFGKFHQKEFLLAPGLNVATTANESGKTTLRYFIRSMWYGLERERGVKARKDSYTRLKPWYSGRFQGSMEFSCREGRYRLTRNFLTAEKNVSLYRLSDGQIMEDSAAFLYAQGLVPEEVYRNTFWIGNVCLTEEELASELRNHMAGMAYTGGMNLDLQGALERLAKQKRELKKGQPQRELEACMAKLLTVEELRNRQKMQQEEFRAREQEYLLWKQELERAQTEREQLEEKKPGFLAWLLYVCRAIGALFGAGKKKRRELQNRIEACHENMHELLRVVEYTRYELMHTEDELQECEPVKKQYEECRARIEQAEKAIKAIELAEKTLEDISRELYNEYGEKFYRSLSEYAGAFTDGQYTHLTTDENLRLRAITKERSVEISDVSFGTGEQFYLALRFAAADVFDPEMEQPMVLDDTFAAFDEQRLESALLTLSKMKRQILVFSSTGREERALKRMGITYEEVFKETEEYHMDRI